MEQDKLFHDWLTNYLKEQFSKDYSEIMVNYEEEKKHAFEGLYPDLILISHGLVVAVAEVETEQSINNDNAKQSALIIVCLVLYSAQRLLKMRHNS
ncbi:MAG TPA: hypothetical protein VJL89_13100 [Thermodesulfovibrionia bacterium]|nr:hypothetical protein [Thermodesulfovibrionia bacterium]